MAKRTEIIRTPVGEQVDPPKGEGWELVTTRFAKGRRDLIEYVYMQEVDSEGRELLTQGTG